MTRTDIIQTIINQIGAKKYLEIGMGPGLNFNSICCNYKICVDPNPTVPVTHKITSDEFFQTNNQTFDVIFIDGLHYSEQVYKDIINSVNVLSNNGVIICHDLNPQTEVVQRYPQPKPNSEWTGDCWKAWVKIKSERRDLFMCVVDTDYGCGILTKGEQDLIDVKESLTWDFFHNHRTYLLNLISVDLFKQLIKNSSNGQLFSPRY